MMQKYTKVSEEIFWSIISTCCLPILLYGVDSFSLHVVGQEHKPSLNLAIRRCFHMSRRMCPCVICYIL